MRLPISRSQNSSDTDSSGQRVACIKEKFWRDSTEQGSDLSQGWLMNSLSVHSPGLYIVRGKSTRWFSILQFLAWRRRECGDKGTLHNQRMPRILLKEQISSHMPEILLKDVYKKTPKYKSYCCTHMFVSSWSDLIPESAQWSCQRRGCWSQSCSWKCSSPAIFNVFISPARSSQQNAIQIWQLALQNHKIFCLPHHIFVWWWGDVNVRGY